MKSPIVNYFLFVAICFQFIGCGSKVPFTRGASIQNEENKLSGTTAAPSAADFERYVLPVLEQNCTSCHGNPAPDYATALSIVKVGRPAESDLYLKATGQKSHRKILTIESQQARNIEDWINSSPTAATPPPVDIAPTPAAPQTPVTPQPVLGGSACVTVTETGKQVCEDAFKENVLPNLVKSCDRCHDNPAGDYKTALTLIKPGFPLESQLYLVATGKSHKKVWAVDSDGAKSLEVWITGK